MNRWTLYDPATNETWQFPRNPNQMTSTHGAKSMTIFPRNVGFPNGAVYGKSRVLRFRQQPYEWSFSGDIRTEGHHDAFLAWTSKTGRLEITDHLQRTWSIRINGIEFNEERTTKLNPWRFNYTVKAMIYGQVA